MKKTVVPGFLRKRFRQLEETYLAYLWTVRRLRGRITRYFRRFRQKENNWTQIGQISIDRFYIRICCSIPTNCIAVIMKQRKFDDTILRRFERQRQRRSL